MKTLEKGQEKIQKICDELRKDTLEPAKKDAEKIVEAAHARAQEIIRSAEKEAEKLIQDANRKIEQEKNVFHASLSQGVKQSLESLRQDIEKHLFNDQLASLVKEGTANPQLIAKVIEAVVKAVEKEGISTDLSAIISKNVSERDVNQYLVESVLKKLREKSVQIGHFDGGAQVRLHDKRITIDMTDSALKELLSRYVRKDFRKLIFASE